MALLFGMITTASSTRYTENALRSFLEFTPESRGARFILVDNDNSFTLTTDVSALDFSIIRNKQPRGFAHNVNQIVVQALASGCDLIMMNNDLELSHDWLPPLLCNEPTILSPLSNQQVPYGVSNIVLTTQRVAETILCQAHLSLDEFKKFPLAYRFMANSHVRSMQKGLQIPQLVLPYYCVKLPFQVMQETGLFDERYGLGGGEDYDYSLRALLAGFESRFAADSYIFHFGGKSSWDGPESLLQRQTREKTFKEHFAKIWGTPLLDFLLHEKSSSLSDLGFTELNPEPGKLRDHLEKILAAIPEKGVPLSKDWR